MHHLKSLEVIVTNFILSLSQITLTNSSHKNVTSFCSLKVLLISLLPPTQLTKNFDPWYGNRSRSSQDRWIFNHENAQINCLLKRVNEWEMELTCCCWCECGCCWTVCKMESITQRPNLKPHLLWIASTLSF